MNTRDFIEYLHKKLNLAILDKSTDLAMLNGAISFEDYKLKVGFIAGLRMAVDLMAEAQDEIRKGELNEGKERATF
jgi:hypothetical protein